MIRQRVSHIYQCHNSLPFQTLTVIIYLLPNLRSGSLLLFKVTKYDQTEQ